MAVIFMKLEKEAVKCIENIRHEVEQHGCFNDTQNFQFCYYLVH
jgi:hypothetical protein